MGMSAPVQRPDTRDPYYAQHAEGRGWFVVSWAGSLAHKDGKAAFFAGQAEADAFAIELCRAHWYERQARANGEPTPTDA
jgi:hypothetical protein